MSLAVLADHMASKGRNGDSMLVHMTPGEVAGLHALALKHGGELTINPDTGLPEANFLKSLLPMLAGAALNFFVPGLGAAVGGAFGLGAAAGTGIAVGGLTALATGSLSRGLMAGMGAYGGAGLAEGLGTAGLQSEVAANMPTLAGQAPEQVAEYARQVDNVRGAAINKFNGMGGMDKLSAGFDAAKAAPGAFLKDNLMPLAAAAAPIMADMMVPTTTKMPEATDTGYIRQKVYDPGTQTYRSLTPVKANEFKDRSFSDIYRGYNNGGIVALAAGGMQHYEEGGLTADQAQKLVEAQYATIGRTGVGTGANQIDQAGLQGWTDALVRGDLKATDLGSRFGTAVTDYMAQNPADQYTNYVKDYQAKQPGTTGAKIETVDGGGDIGFTSNAATTGGITSLGNVGDINYVAKDPGIIKDTNQYFAANPDVAAAYTVNNYGLTPEQFAQTHYDKYGSTEQRSSPLTTTSNSNAYLLANPDVAAEYAKNSYGMTPAELAAYHSTTYGNTEQRATPITEAQNMVANMYRNVLGRDPDPTGLAFWSNAIASGRSPESIYKDFLASARSNTELVTADQVKNATFADATKAYKGYMSTDATNVVDDWVRNTLGREPTAADRQQQWYKDAFTSMSTVDQAKGLYGQFQGYAGAEASKEIANRIKAIDAELKAKNLTEADLLAQTGKTKQQLASEGLNTGLNFMGASQLAPAGSRTAYDLKAALKKLTPITTPQTNAPAGTTNPYGNKTNPGDITRNADGTITVTPNIPGRPYGGFSGMSEVKDAYTRGGGSLGYTSPVVSSPEEFEARYNKLTGDSEAAYNYLMGKGAYPTKSGVGEIARPYREATMGYSASTNKAYNYDAATGKMVRNPDYAAPGRDAAGNVTYSMSLNEIKKYLATTPLSGQALYDWAKSNDASAQDIADATGRKLSEVYAEFRDAAKKATAAKTAAATVDAPVTGVDNTFGMAMGGTTGYAVGGGLGSLGSYSDGGRLLKGPGDGVSDSIPATIGQKQQPARLADGEFVVPARIVSELGNGSTDAGAKKLYAMMDRVQRARGKTTGKNKVAANSRADKYLPA